MKKKHTYQAVQVQQIRVSALVGLLVGGCVVALDVAKMKMLVAIATVAGEVVKLFRFEHPTETGEFLRIVGELRSQIEGGEVVVAMEPTGTYGDALRHQLVKSGTRVFMVSPKRTYDCKEVFDGVPSLHDPKSAVVIAKLHALGLSTSWEPPSATRTRLRALVDLRQHEHRREEECQGRLEALMARHWPEHAQWADVRQQKSALHMLVEYPSPARVEAEPEGVRGLLHAASHGRLMPEAVAGLLAGAQSSWGVPMVPEQERMVQTLASEVLDARTRKEELEHQMQAVGDEDVVYVRLRGWMGPVTAAVMVSMCDPRQYPKAFLLEKTTGLNLREKSSGQVTGRPSITKRGPSLVRQMLYLFALRMIQSDAIVRAWYEKREGYTDRARTRAVVAVMRKLVRAMFYVAKGETFDASKLFDRRRLDLGSTKACATTRPAEPSASNTTAVSTTVAETIAAAPTETVVAAPAETIAAAPAETIAAAPTETVVAAPAETIAAAPTETVVAAPAETIAAAPTETVVTARMTRPRTSSKAKALPVPKPSAGTSKLDASAPPATSRPAPPSRTEDDVMPPVAREGTRPVEEASEALPMPLAEVRAAAKAAAAACRSVAPTGLSSPAVLPRTTPRPIARDRRRSQRRASAST